MRYEVLIDRGETPNKCTIAPLSDHPDFRLRFVKDGISPLTAPVLLHPDGACLTELRQSLGSISAIACIDCVWSKLDGLIRRIPGELPALARIPKGFQTAYPRISKYDTDPDGGLATIEAIFIAAAVLGRWDPSLLSKYYFGHRFIEMNRARFIELGVAEAAAPDALPPPAFRKRTSIERKHDRGRF